MAIIANVDGQVEAKPPIPMLVEKITKSRNQAGMAGRDCPFGIETCPGCVGLDAAEHDQHRLHNPTRITSPSMQRRQIMARFLSHHYPAGMPESFHVHEKLSKWFDSTDVASVAAADCTLLLHYARTLNDNEILVHEARKRYGLALAIVRHKLAQSSSVRNDRDLPAAIEMLRLCGHYSEISGEQQEEGNSHEQGLKFLVLSRGPAILKDDRLSDMLLNFFHCMIKNCLLSRKTCPLATKRWQKAMLAKYPGRGSMLLCQIARLGGALERTDAICAAAADGRRSPPHLVMETLTELMQIETIMNSWLWSYYKEIDQMPYHFVDMAKRFPAFAEAVKSPHSFRSAFDFDSFPHALKHGYFWTFLLHTRIAVYDIVTSQPDAPWLLPDMTAAEEEKWLRDAATDCADALCQSTPWLYCYGLPKSELRVCLMLAAPHQWYQRLGMVEKAEWVGKAASLMEGRSFNTGRQLESLSVGKAFAGWSTLVSEVEDRVRS